MVPMLVSLFVALCLFYEANFLKSCLMLFCYSVFHPFSIAIALLVEERANINAFCTFVRFSVVWFCLFSLPLVDWEGLRCDCSTP